MTTLPFDTLDSSLTLVELIYRLKIKDAMVRNVHTAGRTDSLRTIQKLMKESSVTGIPVKDGKRLIGLVSVDDIMSALDGNYIEDKAEDHMSRNLIVLEDDMPLSFAISYFEKYRYGRFPVLNKDKELVGIISSRDIIVSLLLEINKEVERLERENDSGSQQTESGHMVRRFMVKQLDFEKAGKASTEIKKLLKAKGIDTRLIRRIAVAAYELEMNLVVHTHGGSLSITLEPDHVEIRAQDRGPGIEDVELAQTEGYSTANEWIRSLGFGAGMGLPNVKRVSDQFSIQSKPGEGSLVVCTINLPQEDSHDDKPDD
ncbi:MAG: CBS domain-containing protein [Spirochaetales bacterium]|nr:CBS domain-containing protein [Spirochaetales bacterium]MCF7939281.1 CBS domain-containing protein [Spirochaetales bacterium]